MTDIREGLERGLTLARAVGAAAREALCRSGTDADNTLALVFRFRPGNAPGHRR